jgi:zinc D-Ala-D-Ala carboxypeptidase
MSQHFKLEELERSQIALERGIQNRCPEPLRINLSFTAAGLERLRAYLGGKAIVIDSGYRCPELNRLVRGSDRSQHLSGQAADIRCPGFGDPQAVARALLPARFILGIDQLILEATWVHVSFTLEPRYQVLRCIAPGEYLEGLG